MKYKTAVIGLRMGDSWAHAADENPDSELYLCYDKYYRENTLINHAYYEEKKVILANSMEEVCASDADIVVVASPDHFHTEQCILALDAGKHVICEKPLAPTVAECRKIVEAVKRSGRNFMTGQVCRYAPGFKTAKLLLDSGRIGELACIESEYAHDYTHAKGYNNWRMDPVIKREGFLGGGCHALDLTRWIAGDPLEVFAYMNHKLIPEWPTNDTGLAVAKFRNDVIGRIFVSVGVKRPYTMRTVLYGTRGTIICDNKSDFIQISEECLSKASGTMDFIHIPVNIRSHNVSEEFNEFLQYLKMGKQCPTDVYQGSATVAFAEAALRSAVSGKPEKIESI